MREGEDWLKEVIGLELWLPPGGYYWHLMGRGQEYCPSPYRLRTTPKQKNYLA